MLRITVAKWVKTAICLIPAGMLLLAGCIFEPRGAELPSTGDEIRYNPRDRAENVLDNAQTALNARDNGGYDDVISESFTYEPDDQTLAAYPAVDWAGWNEAAEQDFAASLFQNVTDLQMNLRDSTITVETPSGTEAEFDVIYFLKVTDITGETRYRGRAELTFKLLGAFWYLDKWIDLNQESDPDTGAELPTMGSLRGALASN